MIAETDVRGRPDHKQAAATVENELPADGHLRQMQDGANSDLKLIRLTPADAPTSDAHLARAMQTAEALDRGSA